ncbi:hypothetical protein LPW11_08065 [Geomonas sp. RF6]|uniref:enolase C-terminal domain-like protein n=1 Tax=Geomonas sp. RF6 TaxID=2897342 RepID=UPI001E35458E|nr:enolase C-terminal domain-like protein [Geomonas sp. RF6]UFS72134.1 hypothetical protein LPW11_08065 [Geomonas sp. RF6]
MKGVVEHLSVEVLKIPTDSPEGDGTFRWDSTTMVLVHLAAEGARGIGYSYADAAAATLIEGKLAELVLGRTPFDIPACRAAMTASLRNLGADGIGMLALSAVDAALWDLKGKLLDLPLVRLLGGARGSVPVYGSGGFTTYTREQLQRQLSGWVEHGIPRVKMKVGAGVREEVDRVGAAREAIGAKAELFIDANGACTPKGALALAEAILPHRVSWFEEPVPHSDRAGLRQVRERAPAGMEIAAGEYGFTLGYFHDLLAAGAVDVLQADATRCGISGFMEAAVLASAYGVPLSAHCAPSLNLHPCCASPAVRHLEYFHDHVRIERLLFEGFVEPACGELAPAPARPGLGVTLREDVARRYRM